MKKEDLKQLSILIGQVKENNQDAFVELYSRMYQRIYFLAMSIVKDEYLAQDVVQETFINVYRSIDTLQENITFMAWINRIAYNCSLKILAKNKEILLDAEALEQEMGVPGHDGVLEAVLHKETRQSLMDFVLLLPPEYKTVLILRYYKGLSMEEIADCLDCCVGTVKSRLNRGKKVLRKNLMAKDRFLLGLALCSISLAGTMTSYAKSTAMSSGVAKGALDTAMGKLGLKAVGGFQVTSPAAAPLLAAAPKIAAAVFGAGILAAGFAVGQMSPAITVSYERETYVNRPILITAEIETLIPVNSVILEYGERKEKALKSAKHGVYQVKAYGNGNYVLTVTLDNGKKCNNEFQITNIDTGRPELNSYTWDLEANRFSCILYDELSGINYLKLYKEDAGGVRSEPLSYNENTGEVWFELSAEPFSITLYDKSQNYATYRISPYQYKD